VEVKSWEYDLARWQAQRDAAAIANMFYPVRCTWCSTIYDAGKVEVTARYSDCSCWVSPCCKRQVDDRGRGWKSRPDIEVIQR
jgi:hypothetical protein